MSATLLVVDDDPDYAESMRMILQMDGYHVITAPDGLTAWESIKEHQPDVLLFDWNLPGLNGIELTKRVKADPLYNDRYVIMVTARSDPQAIAEGMNAGADDYLTKPYDRRELVARVRVGLRTRNMQKALADEVRILQRAVEQSPVSIVITDTRGTIEYVNQHFTQVTGYSLNEAVGKNPRILKSGENTPEEYQQLWNTIVSGGEWRGEFHNKRKNGELYWEYASLSPIKNEKGEITHFLAVKEDITERKRAEEELRESEEKYRTILENIEDGYYETDVAGNFTFFNDSLCGILGYPHDELLGMNNRKYMDDQNAKKVYQTFNEVYRTGKPAKAFDWEVIRQDGNRRFTEASVSLRKDSTGEHIGFRGIVRDITERKRAEDAVRQSQQQYENLVGSIDGIVWEADARTFQFTFVSRQAERLLGYPTERWLTEPTFWKDHIYSDDQEWAVALCVSATGDKQNHDFEYRMITADGRIVWLRDIVSVIVENDLPVKLRGVMVDITERKRAEEERRESELRYKTLFESANDAIFLMKGDSFIDCNARTLSIFGCTREQILRKKPTDFSPLLQPDGRPSLEKASEKINSVLRDESAFFEWQHQRFDGTLFDAEVGLNRVELNQELYIQAIVRDITDRKSAEEARHAIETKYKQLVQQAVEGIFIADVEGNLLLVNQKSCEMLGYTENELLRINIADTYPAEQKSLALERMRGISPGKTAQFERRMRRKDGSLFPVEVSLGKLHDGSFQGIVRDITERKQIEAELKLLALTVACAQDCVSITDMEDKVIFVNEAFRRTYRYSEEELLGKNIAMVRSPLTPSDVGAQILPATLAGGWNGEIFNRRKDGTDFPIELWTSVVLDEQGKPVGLLGVARDITDRKRTEEAIRQSELQFRLVWENSADGMRLTNQQGVVLMVNEAFCRMIGKPREEIEGSPFPMIYAEAEREHILKRHQDRFVAREINPHVERELTLWNGKKIWLEATNSFFEVEGQAPRLLSIFRDITDRKRHEKERRSLEKQIRQRNLELEQTLAEIKQMQASLVQSEKMASIGQLTAGIAHEINNPLAFVSSNLNRFKEYFDDTLSVLKEWQKLGEDLNQNPLWQPQLKMLKSKEQQTDLAFITEDFGNLMHHSRDGAERIKSIVDRLRGFSHVSGTEFAYANINEALDDTLTIVWNELKYKATIKKEYGAIPPINCNIGELKQVFINLMVNAAHALREKGEITLRTSQEGNKVFIQVSDTGTGITPEHLKKIFDPFFTTKAVGKGTGLGLWISATIIEKHEGTITVESELGRGTTFTIKLPIQQENKPEKE